MEDSAIREGFQKLRPGTEYDPYMRRLYAGSEPTGLSESTPPGFFSCLYGQTLNVGRVMTPTLAMVVMRDAAIRASTGAVLLGRIKISGFSSGR